MGNNKANSYTWKTRVGSQNHSSSVYKQSPGENAIDLIQQYNTRVTDTEMAIRSLFGTVRDTGKHWQRSLPLHCLIIFMSMRKLWCRELKLPRHFFTYGVSVWKAAMMDLFPYPAFLVLPADFSNLRLAPASTTMYMNWLNVKNLGRIPSLNTKWTGQWFNL
jgi:hypothetical protein